jgi:hypothetical protein
MRRTTVICSGLLVALLLAACGGDGRDGGGEEPPAPMPPDEAMGFDEEVSLERARSYLGVAEEDVEETVMVRILRRGDESFAGTMDLRPGRFNLELDQDDEGVYRVTRVVVETEDGEVVVE